MNFFDEKSLNKIIKTFVVILIISIIALVAVFMFYNKKLSKNAEEYSLAREDYDSSILPNDSTKEASSTDDKDIEKVKIEINNTPKDITINSSQNKSVDSVSDNKKEDVQNAQENNTVEKPVVKEKKELKFEAPISGEISKDFANETLLYSKTLDEWTTHSGIDIKAEKTSIVKAAESGTIECIKNDPRYGLTIIIVHNDGYKTVYSNLLTTEFVSEGKNVEKGDTIATVGESASFEILDDCHLHFEMYKDEVAVNPTIYLK